MKKINIIILCSLYIYSTSNAEVIDKNSKSKFFLTHDQLKSDIKYKKKLQKSLSFEQFLWILEELAILQAKNEEQEKRLHVYEEWEKNEKDRNAKIKEEYENKLALYEEKLKNAYVDGDKARGKVLEQIKTEGIDPKHVRYKVQVGEFNTYSSADVVKKTVRNKAGIAAGIIVTYKGLVIDLKMVEEQINNELRTPNH